MKASDSCPNCNQLLHGQYCSHCGQNQKGTDRYFLTLINEAFEGLFSFNSKAWRTGFFLMFRPGFLTREHFANRRARYISPLRLYLISSIGFFLLLSITVFFSPDPSGGLEINLTSSETEKSENSEEPITAPQTSQPPVKTEIDPAISSDEHKKSWSRLLDDKLKKGISVLEERPKLFVSKLLDSIPPVVLILLPLFALVLKIFYMRSKRFYTQHLVLAVHNHSFLFIALTVVTALSTLLDDKLSAPLSLAIWVWICIYMVASLKTTFEQSWLITGVKSIAIMVIYFLLFSAAFVCAVVLGIVSL